MNIIPLNIKTNYELLSSIIKIDDLINYALKNNIKTLGVTDSNLFSFMEFYEDCKKNDIKPIIGIDLELLNHKFILYAKNYKGYQNLCRIVSEKNINELTFEYIENNNIDIICVLKSFNQGSYDLLTRIFDEVFIGYKNDNEKKEALIISDKILYIPEVLCFNESEYEYLKYLYMIKDGTTILDIENYKFENNYFNLGSYSNEDNSDFSNLIDLELPNFLFKLPKYKDNSIEYLRSLCKKGLDKRLNNKVDEKYSSRLLYELDVIENTGFVDYFLIVYDIVLYAKKNNIYVGPGRGSAVGSLVSYSLGIIDIDPLKYNLMFERFLNPSRVSMPDIDIDISDVKREELINYVIKKYGVDKVANIITFSTLLPKQVLRDVGRTLNISVPKMDSLLSLLKDKDSLEVLESNPKYKDLIIFNKEYIKLLDVSKKLEGLKKHASIHAAGIVIDSEPLTNKVPLFKSGNNILVGYDKKHIEELGILKIDLLSIRNLSILDEVLNKIKESTGKIVSLNDIPLDDPKTIEMFAKAETTGVFQYESSGIRNLLRKMNTKNFNDLVLVIAMFRPGPMGMIPTYLKRREGKEEVTYPVKELEPVLKDTMGIMIYQEQLLEILNVMAGYTYSEADIVRSAIKSKNESILLKERERFESQSVKLGFKKSDAENVYDMILKFASYGFNKSHSVAYAMVGYQMAYLKANYTDIFMVNLLNKEIGRESKTKEYIDESKVLGLEFSEIDINLSKDIFYSEGGKIIMPLGSVKNVGEMAIKRILQERDKGKFINFIDFCSRCYNNAVNKKVLESLILIGAFDNYGYNKKTLIENLEEIINYSLLCQELSKDNVMLPEIVLYGEYDESYLLEKESELLGFYFSNHPVTKYKRDITLDNVNKYYDKNVNMILLIENIKEIKTKNNDKMAFMKLSDEYGCVDAVIFPNYYKEIYNILKKMQVAKIYCKVEKRLNEYQLVVNKIDVL